MRWSWRLADIAGVSFYLHTAFLLLFSWVALVYWQQRQGLGAVIECFVFMLAILASVVLHDLGHLVVAKKLGIRLRNITLLPIGGVVRLQSVPKDWMKGIWIAIAGPGLSLFVTSALYGLLSIATTHVSLQTLDVAQGPILQRLLWFNLFLGGFNLLPALPMDGGIALRSILMTRMGYSRATQTTAAIGQGGTLLLGLTGFWLVSPFLLFVALLVWIGSTREAALLQMRSALRGIPVGQVMIQDVQTLSSDTTLEEALRVSGSQRQRDFPVVDDREIVGVLTHQELLSALAEGKQKTPVAEIMNPIFQSTNPLEMLDLAITRMLECDCTAIPVFKGGQIVGLLTQERIGEFVSSKAGRGSGRTRT